VGEAFGIVFFNYQICKREWIFLGSIPILILTQIRAFADMKFLLWFNMMTILTTILVSLAYVGSLGLSTTIPPGSETEVVATSLTALSFTGAMSTFAFAYAGQFIYLEFMDEMQEPHDFPKALQRFSVPFQGFVYLITSCIGYYLKGQNATGLMVNWIPYNGWIRFAALLLFLHVIIVYLIKAQILATEFHRYLFPATLHRTSWLSRLHWFIITFAILIFCIFIAEIIPFFDSLTGLIGSSLVPVTNWMLPVVFFIWVKQREQESIAWYEWIVLIFILLLGLALTGVGTYSSWQSISDSWGNFGYPFSCGCEGIWNTCDCSSDHTGMDC